MPSVIQGNIKYFASFKSIEELQNDKNLRKDKVIMLEQGNYLSLYSIRESVKDTDKYIALSTGFYAVEVMSVSVDIGGYTTLEPIKISLGGVEKGTEFKNAPYSDVFNALFFPKEEVFFDVSVNVNLVNLKGTEVFLTEVDVKDITVGSHVDKLVLYIGGQEVKSEEINAEIRDFKFLINKVITEDCELKVILVSGTESYEVIRQFVFSNPVYWATVSEHYAPSSPSVQRMNVVANTEGFINVDISTADTCVFVAIDSALKIEKILDNQGNDFLDNFEIGQVTMWFGENSVVYTTYQSHRTTVDDFKLRVFIKEG